MLHEATLHLLTDQVSKHCHMELPASEADAALVLLPVACHIPAENAKSKFTCLDTFRQGGLPTRRLYSRISVKIARP